MPLGGALFGKVTEPIYTPLLPTAGNPRPNLQERLVGLARPHGRSVIQLQQIYEIEKLQLIHYKLMVHKRTKSN